MFAGLFPFHPERLAESLLPESVLSRLDSLPPHQLRRAGNSLWFAGRALQATRSPDDTQWHQDASTGLLVAFWGRLDNRDALADRWGAALQEPGTSDADRIAAGWRHDGEAVVDRLVGEFGFVVVATMQRRVLLARDPLGVRPLSYRITDDGLWVASSLPLLRSLVREPTGPGDDWIRRFLIQRSSHDTRTAFADIHRLAPGHLLAVSDGGEHVPRRWFSWRDDPPSARRRDGQWVDRYRAAFEEAVRCRWGGDAPIASENSAGIDSAAVTALLARQVPDAARRILSVGLANFDDEGMDILGLSRSAGVNHNHILSQVGQAPSEGDLRNALRAIGHPEENGIGTGMAPLHEVCRVLGVRHLFSGFGGDEAASHPAGELRRELVDARDYRALFGILPGALPARLLRLARAAWTGLPAARPGTPGQFAMLLDLLELSDADRRGLAEEERRSTWQREGCRSVNESVITTRLGSPHVATRLEGCTLIAAARGLQYHWPLLDVRLIQQYLSTPSIEKQGPGGIGRYLHRRAIDPFVPRRITWRPTKDIGQSANLGRIREGALRVAAERGDRLSANLHPRLEELLRMPELRRRFSLASASAMPLLDAGARLGESLARGPGRRQPGGHALTRGQAGRPWSSR
jgi:asparagine synthase (glutamine-hydrolysing)